MQQQKSNPADKQDLVNLMDRIIASDDMKALVTHPQFPKDNSAILQQFDTLANMVAGNGLSPQTNAELLRIQKESEADDKAAAAARSTPSDAASSPAATDAARLQAISDRQQAANAARKAQEEKPLYKAKEQPGMVDGLLELLKKSIINETKSK